MNRDRAEGDGAEGAFETPSPRPMWSGTLSFALVTVPVDLYPANRRTRSSLRMLSDDGTPLVRRYFEPGGDKPLDAEHLERAYELDDGRFVPLTDEELESLAPEKARDIDLTRFVDVAEVPPLYFERAYYLVPSGDSNLAYRLLSATMERTGKAGLASFVMRGKQYPVAIFAEHGVLRAQTLRFPEEVRTPEDVGLPEPATAPREVVSAVKKAVQKLEKGGFAPEELRDSYWERLTELVEQKRTRHEDVIDPPEELPQEQASAQIIDLVAVLKKSLSADRERAAAARGESPKKRAPRARRQPSARKSAPASKSTKSGGRRGAARG